MRLSPSKSRVDRATRSSWAASLNLCDGDDQRRHHVHDQQARGGRSLGVEAAGRIRAVTAVALNSTCFSLCALVTGWDCGCFIRATAATQLQEPLLEAAEPAVECRVAVCGRGVVLFEPGLRGLYHLYTPRTSKPPSPVCLWFTFREFNLKR